MITSQNIDYTELFKVFQNDIMLHNLCYANISLSRAIEKLCEEVLKISDGSKVAQIMKEIHGVDFDKLELIWESTAVVRSKALNELLFKNMREQHGAGGWVVCDSK